MTKTESYILAATMAVAGAAIGFFVSQKCAEHRSRASLQLTAIDDNALHLHDEESANDTSRCIYLDYNGTTPVYPQILQAMLPYLTTQFGNPSSGHLFHRQPRQAVDRARKQLLTLLGQPEADLSSIWFTSCGTESDNLAIQLALQSSSKLISTRFGAHTLPHIVSCNVEHPAISGYLDALVEEKVCEVTYVPVQSDGMVSADAMIAAIQPQTILMTLMLANNESGALQPVQKVAQHCSKANILFHTDAAQAVGKVSVDLDDLGHPDMISIVGHKMGAPKGIACLYVRPGCCEQHGRALHNRGILLIGGGQEHGRRGGTENVPYIVGFGEAASLATKDWKSNSIKMEGLRTRLLFNLENWLGKDMVRTNGPSNPAHRLPNTLSVGLKGIHSGALLAAIGDQVAASAGATCHSASGVSSVLKAMGVPETFARGTLRLSLGTHTTEQEVDKASAIIVAQARKMTTP